MLVAGEAGVGKSALLEQLQADVPDARWSWGACDGLFTPRPLGPLFDLAGQLGGELLRLCRAQAAREELFDALLRQVSEPGALRVLVMEDVHWADEATVDLLRFLGRRLRNASVLLIATYRDDGLTVADPLRIALGDLATQRSTRRVGLTSLSAEAVRVLAGGSRLEAAALYRLTGGNPFFVTEVVRAGMGVVPPSARDAVLARVARLSGPAGAALEVAALTGTRVELDLVESVTGGPAQVADELVASGLLVADGGVVRFRHEIVRLAVEQSVATHRHGTIHARILEALRLAGCDDDARLAFHAEGAGDGPAVLQYASSAGRRAAELGSHREAAAQFERALRFSARSDPPRSDRAGADPPRSDPPRSDRAGSDPARSDPTGPDPAEVARLYNELAIELSLLDRRQDAADACERALALWRQAGDRLREGDTLRQLAPALGSLCRGQDANAAAESAVSILQPLGPTAELAWAYVHLAARRMVTYDHHAAIELAQRAQAIAGPLGLTTVLSEALNTQGCSTAFTGGEWTGLLRRALEIALAAGLHTQAGRAYNNIYSIYSDKRRFAEGEPYFTDGVAYCDDHDLRTFSTSLRGMRASVLERTGRWDESVAMSTELLDRAGPSPSNRLSPLNLLGTIRARRGEPGVWEYFDEAVMYADGTGEPQEIVAVRVCRAEAYWLEGKQELARREAELADDACVNCHEWEYGGVAVWLQSTASARPPRGELAEPCRLQVEGDWQQAAAAWTGLGCPYNAAMALLDATGETPLREALRIFTDLGASPAARITRQKMRTLGIRSIPAGPRTATRADPLGLTRREHEVLDLICDGHTNAEIAALLFISVKTVDHHVSAVLAKLGATTRLAAAARAADLGLTHAAGA